MMNSAQGRRATILVVEDVGWIRAGMKRSLKFYGYLVLEASDADEAIASGERAHPDLILTEEDLPTFDTLLMRLREHAALRGVPVVIINPDEEEGARYGDVQVLSDYHRIERLLASSPNQPERE